MADRTVRYRIQADIGQFRAQMAQAGASTRKLATDLTSMEKSAVNNRRALDTLGGAAGKVGLVAAGGLAVATKAAIDWESAFAGVEKTVDGTAAQMAGLEDELRGLARTMPASHQEIAATAEAAGQLGIAREDVTAFTETMLQLGETTNLTADEAATSLARFSNIMGTSSDDISRMGAAVVGLGNNFATTEAEVVEISTRLAAAGRQAGLTEADVFGVAAAMSSVGVEAEAGGTAMSKVFTSIGDAVRSGDGNLQTFAEVAGVTADEFQRMYQSDPSEAIGAFVEGMGAVAREGGNTSQIFKDLGLTDQRLMRAILSVGSATGSWAEATGLANEEWEQNTALTDEFAKRAGTTAAQVQVSWNNIKDASIDVGAAMLPVVEQLASGAASMASAFSSLPGPVKSATGPILGLTAILGGSVWAGTKIINGIADAREAMDTLGISAGKTGGALGKVARAAGIAGGALIALSTVDMLQRQFEGLDTGLEGVTTKLLDLADAGTGGLGGEFDNLAESFDRLTDPNKAQAFQDSIYDTFGFLGSDSRVDEAVAQFEAVDAALAGIVTSGSPEQARETFASLAASLGVTGAAQKDLLALLPQYGDALDGVANDQRLAAGSADGLAGASDKSAAAQQEAAVAAKKQAAALGESREAASGTASAFFSVADAAGQGKRSLGGFLRDLEEQAEALRNFRVNAQQAAKRGLSQGLIAELQRLGPEGARQMKQLANATDSEIKRANKAWQAGQREVRTYTNAVGGVPTKVTTNVDVNTGSAMSQISQVDRWLDMLDGKRATTYIDTIRTGARRVPGLQMAAGGAVNGPGTATSDSVPAWLSDGEFVMKAAAVDRYGEHFFHQLNAMRFAQGGPVSAPSGHRFDFAPAVLDVRYPDGRTEQIRLIARQEIDRERRHDRIMEGR